MNHPNRQLFPGKLIALATCCVLQHGAFAAGSDCADAPLALAERSNQTANHCPAANAGLDTLAAFDQAVTLDASKSTDIDGEALSYRWQLMSAPTGSGASIASPGAVRTAFTPDLPGDYAVQLTVTDARGAISTDVLNVSTQRTAPVANAGTDLTAAMGSVVDLDGIASFDVDGSELTYKWQLLSAPANSNAVLGAGDGMLSSLALDADGDYVVQLIVSDGQASSVADTVRISTRNSRPMARAGRARTLAPGSTLILDGSASADVDDQSLGFEWSLLSAPAGATVELKGADQANPSTYLTDVGLYVFQLVTHDGELLSSPDTVLVEVDDQRIQVNPDDYRHLTRRGGGDDEDGDGVPDPDDNCVVTANADQRDTDGDGIGNACDPDLNNDGVVNVIDLGILRSVFFTTDPDADFNGDGIVNVVDLGILRSLFFLPPGPAGTIIWVSLVDGDFDNRLNWQPQTVPTAASLALIDVAPAVTVTSASDTIVVKGLVNNETLSMSNGSFAASDALENGGTINITNQAINDTQIIPSEAGSGTVTVLSSSSWRSVTLGVATTINNAANITLAESMNINDVLTINAPSSPTGILAASDIILGGTGTIVFNGIGNSVIAEPRIFPFNNVDMTIESGLTLRGGKGTIGNTAADLVFNASAVADIDGEAIRIASRIMSGNGSATAINNGGIEFLVNMNNPLNTINVDGAGGSVTLLANSAVRNGAITMTPGTNMVLPNGSVTFERATINGDLTLQNTANVTVIDRFTLNGSALVNAPSSPTGFLFSTDALLDGNAIITLNGVGNSVVTEPRLFPFSGTTLTIAPTVAIRGGKGTIGQAAGNLIFEGTLTADVDGEELAIGGSNWSANNSMSATNGGAVRLFGTMNNAGQTLTLDTADGDLSMTNATQINNAVIQGTTGSTMRAPGGGFTWTSNVMNIDVEIANSGNINVFSGLTLNGDMLITAPSSPSGLLFNNTQLMDGTGTITLDGVNNSVITEPRLFPVSGTTLTIGPDITIRGGTGTVGQPAGSLVFQGTLISDQPGERLDIGGVMWSSSQMLQGLNGGGIELFGTLDNDGGAFTLDNMTGPTQLRNASVLRDAIINGTTGSNITTLLTSTLDNMVITADLTYNNGANSNVSNGLTLNGTATITAPSSPSGMIFTNTQSLLGNATFVFDSVNNSVITEPRIFPASGTTLSVGPNVRFEGGDATIGQLAAGINLSAATLDANVAGKALQVLGNLWTTTGTLRASNGGEIILGGTLDNASAAFTLDGAGGGVTMNNSTNLRNAVINGTAGTVMNPTLSGTFVNLDYTGDLAFSNGDNISVTDGLTLNGNVTITAPTSPTGLLFTNSQTLDGTANIVFDGVANSVISEPRLFPFSGTTLTIGPNIAIGGGRGTIGQAGGTTIVQGSIIAETDSLVLSAPGASSPGTFGARGGNTLIVTGSLSAPGALIAGPSSLIDVSAAVTMTPATLTTIEVDSAVTAGQVEASTIVHDGTLDMAAVNGYSPAGGEAFMITQTTTASGGSNAFATVNSIGLGGGQSFVVTYDVNGNAVATVN